MDDAYWAKLRGAFSDAEIVELTVSVGMWMSQGRLNQVLDIDACALPSKDERAVLAGG